MKTRVPLLCALLLVLLSACGPEERSAPPEPPEAGPLALASLSVEISRGELSTQELARTVRELPGDLKAALADQGVEAEAVTVSVGSSPEATAQAVRQGNVDMALFAAGDFAALEDPPERILTAGSFAPDLEADPAAWDREGEGCGLASLGAPLLLCAGPTGYGAGLAAKKEPLTWAELSQARWGILEDTPAGRQGAALFLPEGRDVSSLPEAAFYDEAQELLRAAAAGELDLLVLPGGLRLEWSFAWNLDAGQSDNRNGRQGLGRSDDIYDALPALAVSEKLYAMTAAVRPGSEALSGEAFAQALAEALNGLKENYPALGAGLVYAPAADAPLDAQRKLAELGQAFRISPP